MGDIEDLTGLFGVLIPLAAVVLGLGLAFWSIYLDHQKRRLQYQERALMIERGMTPPPELPKETRVASPEASLRRGIVQLSLGIGLAIAAIVLQVADQEGLQWIAGVAAAVVGFLGAGHLTYYYVVRRRQSAGDPGVTTS